MLAGNAMAETVTVDWNATGDYTSIQDAINNSNPGDSILVLSGNYNENLLIDKTLSITSESQNPDTVTIRPIDNQSYAIYINSNDVVLNGFTITGADSSKAVFLYESSGCLIENNIVELNQYGIYLNNSDNNEVVNNTLRSNTLIGLCLFESHDNKIKLTYSSDDFIGFDFVKSCNNTVIDNSLQGDKIYGIYFHEFSDNNSVINNSVIHTYYYEILSSSVSVQRILTSNYYNSDEFELFTKEIEIISNENDTEDNNNLLSSSSSSPYITSSMAVASGNGLYMSHNNTGNLITGNIIINSYYYGININSGSSGNIFYNNYLSNDVNLALNSNGTNIWNIDKTAGENIVGGPYIGGNCWANPSGTGFSQTHLDNDEDGICDENYTINAYNVDYLPLYIDEKNRLYGKYNLFRYRPL